jgi:hypothetical protein
MLQYKEPPIDRLARLLWKNSDWVCGIGVGMVIGALLSLVFGMACFATDHAFMHSLIR